MENKLTLPDLLLWLSGLAISGVYLLSPAPRTYWVLPWFAFWLLLTLWFLSFISDYSIPGIKTITATGIISGTGIGWVGKLPPITWLIPISIWIKVFYDYRRIISKAYRKRQEFRSRQKNSKNKIDKLETEYNTLKKKIASIEEEVKQNKLYYTQFSEIFKLLELPAILNGTREALKKVFRKFPRNNLKPLFYTKSAEKIYSAETGEKIQDSPSERLLSLIHTARESRDEIIKKQKLFGLKINLEEETTNLLILEIEGPTSDKIKNFISLVRQVTTMVFRKNQHYQRMQEYARYDGLTGHMSRWFFFRQMMEILKLGQKKKNACSLIMLDIDHFKGLNDTYGHPAGDKILEELGEVILRSIRNVDLGCRYGGEEFAVLLPHTPPNEAINIAERIRKEIESEVHHPGKEEKVTVSLGVTGRKNLADNWKKLEIPEGFGFIKEAEIPEALLDFINEADQALYQAKETGRNQVCVYQELDL